MGAFGSVASASDGDQGEKDDGDGGSVTPTDTATLRNGEVAVQLNDVGDFIIETDDGRYLTYPSTTSDLTVRVGTENYSYSDMGSYLVQPTTVTDDGTEATTRFELPEGITVTQTVTLSGEAAVFDLEVENTGSRNREVKARYLFDYQVDDQDGAPVFVNGDVVTSETRFQGGEIDTWKTYDQLPDPNLTGTGRVQTRPTKVEFVAWEDAAGTEFAYPGFDPSKDFYTPGSTSSPASDSAALLYYDLDTLAPGESDRIVTSYGVGLPSRESLDDIELAFSEFRAATTQALSTLVRKRAEAHATLYSEIGEPYRDNFVNYFGYKAGADGITRGDVNAEVREKLDELTEGVTVSQYGELYDFFDSMFAAADPSSDVDTLQSTFATYIRGEADAQADGDAAQLRIGGRTIAEIESQYVSDYDSRAAGALQTLTDQELSTEERRRVIQDFDRRTAAMTQRTAEIRRKVDNALSTIRGGGETRVYGKRVDVSEGGTSSQGDELDTDAILTGSALLFTAKFAAVSYGSLGLASLYTSSIGASSTLATGATVSAAYSGSQLASSLSWTLPSMSYWTALQSANSVTSSTSLSALAKGVLKEQVLAEFGLTVGEVFEEYTGVNIDLLLGLGSPKVTLTSLALDQLRDAGADLYRTVDASDLDAPNVPESGIEDGQATATATVQLENTSSETIQPTLVNAETEVRAEPLLQSFLGSVSVEASTLESEFPEIPPGETREGRIRYTFPADWMIGAYELQVTVSPTALESGETQTLTDSFVTARVPDQVGVATIADSRIAGGDRVTNPITSESSTERLGVNLSYPGARSNLDLHLRDGNGNHVGLNYQSGEFENEIPGAVATGPDSNAGNGESIEIRSDAQVTSQDRTTYETEVVAVDTASSGEPFQVSSTSSPSLPPLLNVYGLPTVSTAPGGTVSTSLTVEEAAGSTALQDVTVQAGTFESDTGETIGPGNVSVDRNGFTVAAGSAESVSLSVSAPADATQGQYTGDVQVTTSNGDTQRVPLTVRVGEPNIVERTVSATQVSPGGQVSATVEATVASDSAVITELFEPPFQSVTVDRVLVDGERVDPFVEAVEAGGIVVTVNEVQSGETVRVDYTATVPESGTDVHVIDGVYTSGDRVSRLPIGQTQVSVDSGFGGIVGEYNADGDDDIDLGELSAAARDYANESISLQELSQVASAYARTQGGN